MNTVVLLSSVSGAISEAAARGPPAESRYGINVLFFEKNKTGDADASERRQKKWRR